MATARFEWDAAKDIANQHKHGVDFTAAQFAFADPHRVIAADTSHSEREARFFCFGIVGGGVITGPLHSPQRHHSNSGRGILEKRQTNL